MTPCLKIDMALWVRNGAIGADFYATKGIDDSHEPSEVNFDVMIYPQIRHRLKSLDQKWRTAPSKSRVDLRVSLATDFAL
jgi:hypothetical protein